MSFWLMIAPATFQRVMDIILSSVKWQLALVYLDDMANFSWTLRKENEHTRLFLSNLKRDCVTSRLKHCAFFTNKIDYLRHIIRPDRLEIARHTTDAIRDLRYRLNKLSLAKYRFVHFVSPAFQDFGRITSPLTVRPGRTQANELGKLNKEVLTTLHNLQVNLIFPSLLVLPLIEGRCTL